MHFIIALFGLFLSSQAIAAEMTPVDNAYAFTFTSIEGKPLPLSAYAGKVILVVNTASQCGFTPQYEELQKLHEKYKDKGLVVLGVPSNDFGGQEPGNEREIKAFTHNKFHVTFPLTTKTEVTGDKPHPFYDWAARQENSGLLGARPRWNFHKFLIGRNGLLVGSYISSISPMGDTITGDVEKALNEQ
ncbi:MAG: glutathione peroxidase [Alphaproteobacteria bacterium]|nr:glutathione peroxidase [Alphaproteobacteria bacterium]